VVDRADLLDTAGGEVLALTVAGEPDVGVGQPVSVEGLIAMPWSQGDRSGVAFRATLIRSAGGAMGGLARPTATGGSSDASARSASPSGKPAA
jgi:hypothetical protein